MTTPISSAHAFLHRHGMHPDDLDMHAELQKLRSNMNAVLAGSATPSDCQMLPAFVTIGTPTTPNKKILALDIGGTNLRAALISFTKEGTPQTDSLIVRTVPGLDHPISKKEFLLEIALFTASLAKQANHMGVCFSNQAQITLDGDGKVQQFGKELKITDGAGMLVCKELLEAFSSLGITSINSYALVNDTVAAMLGGFAQFNGICDGVLGFILGTGTNLCYQASSKNIPSLPAQWSASSMIINMESGVYNGFPQGTFDLIVDRASRFPKTCGSEKMIGGVYQGEVLFQTLHGAASEGLLSSVFLSKLCKAKRLTSIDLSEFCLSPSGSGVISSLCENDTERTITEVLARCLLERAAKLVTVTLAAPISEENMGKTADALIIAEGSTFWKNETLRAFIYQHSQHFISRTLGRRFRFFEADSPNLAGAAMAVFQR